MDNSHDLAGGSGARAFLPSSRSRCSVGSLGVEAMDLLDTIEDRKRRGHPFLEWATDDQYDELERLRREAGRRYQAQTPRSPASSAAYAAFERIARCFDRH